MRFGEHRAATELFQDANDQENLMDRDAAYDILQEVRDQYRGNTFDIPLDLYHKYYKAAESYVIIAERAAKHSAPGTLEKDRTYEIAQRVLAEAPTEAQVA
jgi:hypothetical protein